jgi:hypothetical protein
MGRTARNSQIRLQRRYQLFVRPSSDLCLVATQAGPQNPSNSLQWSVLFRWVSMGLISPEPLSLTMRRAAPLDFQELARASGVARQSLTLEL